jgi:hypothetical protein
MRTIRLSKAMLSDKPRRKASILVPIRYGDSDIDIAGGAYRRNVMLVLKDQITSKRADNEEVDALSHAGCVHRVHERPETT